ncbi:SRSO17 transposase [Nonomuraea endophytica]|uniref:SRSO17 transposase n=1 Tax=Nonomuraea endophytica TaxID=714136 RepID=A0A7W8AAE9_9ACTN|nr:SRSO17 transposase [Nonomuraea endophytica]
MQRQCTGTAGKITNCQIGVFAAYAAPDGSRVMIDRELHLPASWFAEPAQLVAADASQYAVFATKPELAWTMIERAADDVLLCFGWVRGDEAYGDNTVLRQQCLSRGLNQVFAVSHDHPITVAGIKTRADIAVAALDRAAWQRYSCGG